jgi:lipopolysaccharide/colanic/teichoic acid biosynthesis glycosyltransferase
MKSHNFSIFLKRYGDYRASSRTSLFRKEIMVLMPSMTLDMLSRLTGWAQVNYAYGANIDDMIKLQYDLYYITVSISI